MNNTLTQNMHKQVLLLLIGFVGLNCESDADRRQAYHEPVLVDYQQDKSYERGKALFVKNCVACHYIGMDKIATAPALGGVTERREKDWLYAYTRNSIEMYKNGDSIAVDLRNQGWSLMFSFPELTDKNLDDLYYFVEKKYATGKGSEE
ncbi:MAG: cytochrome c [Bacteroidota bacterium]